MKIGIEVQRLFRKNKFGIEKSSLELICALRDLEPRHQYVVFVKDDADSSCLLPSENLKIRRVAGKMFVDFEQFFLPLACKREQVDILHCTGNTAPFFSPVPVVQTLHDVIFMDAIPAGDTLYQRFGNHYRRKIVPSVIHRSKAVITVSHFEKQRIVKRLGIPEEKVHVVYNGLNEIRFHTGVTPTRRRTVQNRYDLPETFILFLGNEATRKNPARVVDAYLRYASTHEQPMPMVTPGLSDAFLNDKLHKLNSLDKRHLFVAPGYIRDEDMAALYAMSQVFLFPSLSEGFGMPLVEAMACGTPVVTSSTSCLPEVAGDAAILVDPTKPDQIASAILSLTTDEKLREDRIAAGLQNARRFSWRNTAESVLGIYQKVYEEARLTEKHQGFLHKYVFAQRG